jgi:DNA repair protein RadA/Sms
VKKPKTAYVCAECGATALQWFGACPSCGAAGSLSETVTERSGVRSNRVAAMAVALSEVQPKSLERIPTGIDELDRALGGGLVAAQVALLGGDPGIGKSTLLLQALSAMSGGVLYLTGEESVEQVALRARRLGLETSGVRIAAETQLERVLGALEAARPQVAVIDSIQTLWSETLQSAPGSVAQVRECAAQLTRHAKRAGTALFLVGHVTKEGAIAGPRVLEHIVDTVLYFEGDPNSSFRLVRAIKNRFGAVNELGVFAMTETGLKGVSNPSKLFLSNHDKPVPGSCVLATMEGTRPLLVEIQALVDPAHTPNPRRLSVGLEANRLAMLLAVLHRHAGIARGAASPRRDRHLGAGSVRQRGRRGAHRRAGGRPRGLFLGRFVLHRQADRAEGRGIRRDRPRRRDPARGARPGPSQGSREARLRARGGAAGESAEEQDCRTRNPARRAYRPGGSLTPRTLEAMVRPMPGLPGLTSSWRVPGRITRSMSSIAIAPSTT